MIKRFTPDSLTLYFARPPFASDTHNARPRLGAILARNKYPNAVLMGISMLDQTRSADELVAELISLREQVTILKLSEIQRKHAEEALRLSEELNKAILSSLNEQIAVLDKDGNIISVNEAWERHAHQVGIPLQASLRVGANYFDACKSATGKSSELGREVLRAIYIVKSGAQTDYTLEYEERSSGDTRWYLLNVTKLANEDGGLVIAHIDITERKRAEEERERM